MKIPVSLLASLLVVGLVAAPVSADQTRYVPTDQASVEDICAPTADLAFSRDQLREKSSSLVVGTLKGTVGLTDILFSDFTGTLDLQLILFGEDAMGGPLLLPGPPVSIEGHRGRWTLRNRVDPTPGQIDATSVVLRPSKAGDTGNLTVKFQAAMPDGVAWGVDFIGTGVGVIGTLGDGTTECPGTFDVMFQNLADLTD